MNRKDVIEYIANDIQEKKNRRDSLLCAYSVGETLPNGFEDWDEVDTSISNLDRIIGQMEDALYNFNCLLD